MSLHDSVLYLYPDAVVDVDYKLQDDGDGPYIKEWNFGDVDKPTDDQLSAITSEAENNKKIKLQIADLESMVTARRYREAVLGIDGGWLSDLNQKIVTLRNQLT